MIAIVVAVVLILGAGILLYDCSAKRVEDDNGNENPANNDGKPKPPPKGVKDITSSNQTVGDAIVVNYYVTITNDVSWNSMSKDEKQVIIDYVFSEVYRMNSEKGMKQFNVLGRADGSGEVLFAFDKEYDEMIVYKSGVEEYRFSAPPKK